MLSKKQNLKSGKSRDKERGFEKHRREETPPKEKGLMKKHCNLIFWCCSSHETKAKKNQK